jgi:asparagine synthetase B (glutamine-hydrolysing)
MSRSARPKPWLRAEHHTLFRDTFARALAPSQTWILPGRAQRFRILRDLSIRPVMEQVNRRARLRHGVELRHPLLDHRLFEFAASLPTTQTFRAGQRKIIMRNAMRGILPDEIVDMWGKIYPTAISERGLREREQAKVWALMTNMRAAELGLVDEQRLRQAYQDYLDRKTDNVLFWYTLTLEDWLRRYF